MNEWMHKWLSDQWMGSSDEWLPYSVVGNLLANRLPTISSLTYDSDSNYDSDFFASENQP